MSNLSDLLAKRNLPSEPAEFAAIRQFIVERYQCQPKLSLRGDSIIISMPGSAAAGSLKFDLPELKNLLSSPSKYKLVISAN